MYYFIFNVLRGCSVSNLIGSMSIQNTAGTMHGTLLSSHRLLEIEDKLLSTVFQFGAFSPCSCNIMKVQSSAESVFEK
jgi:hypothetical protein